MITLNIATFRELFTEFSNTETYPDETITMNWETATMFISDEDYGWMSTAQRERSLYLATAHVLKISTALSTGGDLRIINSSSRDKISVTAEAPKLKTQFQYWLGLTGYGMQLLTILKAASVGGLYVGGRPERSAFRKVGGSF